MKYFVFSLFLFLIAPLFVFAGTIDATNKYARFLSSGTLINFGTTYGNVAVTSSAVTGYAWSTEFGWINLSPTNGGVVNDGNGVLSGYAWGEHTGWINFKPTNGGVTINTSSGDFSGYAWSEVRGWIVFSCATDNTCGTLSHKVQTDWVPTTVPIAVGGGGIISPTPASVTTPTSEPAPTPEPTTEPTSTPEPTTEPTSTPEPTTEPTPTPESTTESTPTINEPQGVSESTIVDTVASFGDVFLPQIIDITTNVTEFIAHSIVMIKGNAGEAIMQAKKVVVQARQEIKITLETPVGEVSSKTITTAGVVASGTTSLFTIFFSQVMSLKDLLLLPAQLWGLLLSAFGLKRRYRPWGAVYDSVTKQPLDPAYVELQTLSGKEVATAFTDLDGRYGFFVPPGTYRIVANKSNYKFPSARLTGKTEDEFYGNLYFGETIVLREGEMFLARDIPMDPEGFDWNEYAKRAQRLMGFYSRNTIFIERLSRILFITGFFTTLLVLFVDPQPYTIVLGTLYLFVWVLRKVGLADRPHGVVIEKETGLPLAFGVVKVLRPDNSVEVRKSITDALGRYYCLVAKGSYKVGVMRKEQDGTYSEVEFSENVQAPRGIIRKKFEI